jgi:hypothetical protein
MGIISAGMATMFASVQRNYSVEEARTGIKTGTQTAVNKIALNLTATKRLFQNTASDNAFLALVTPNPAAIAGSVLPAINDGASMSPSSSTFVASAVGNSLFFVSLDTGPFVTNPQIADSIASLHTIRIDSYHFNYYYLAQNASPIVGGGGQLMLQEWHSFSVADYNQVAAWTNATLQSNLVKALYNAGFRYAWDSSQSATASAFYSLGSGGALTLAAAPALTANVTNASLASGAMIKLTTGILGSGYRYGVSPNTSGSFSLPYAVPQFGTASGQFPSGFEIVAVGSSSARQILIRLVVAAQGAFKGNIANQQITVASARDIH